MLHYAVIFLSVGLIVGGLNVLGLATLVTQGAWTLLLSGVVLVIIHRVAERTDRVSSLIRSTVRVHP
ncbi:MAG: hypothetical protein OEV01_14910 [Nitrospira sp.]|nr:hypothetical protein [Nitrospira sp.]MDH4304261.1 hypothetical protein [Nitrospira sp.]MDH5195292.1 hypothetical protein [Nitrospira sp.]